MAKRAVSHRYPYHNEQIERNDRENRNDYQKCIDCVEIERIAMHAQLLVLPDIHNHNAQIERNDRENRNDCQKRIDCVESPLNRRFAVV